MSQSEVIRILHRGLIVSCQAPADSPLHEPNVVAAMAQAAVKQGAVGVRVDTPTHIQAVRQRIKLPIVGLWKQVIPGFEVYITPQVHHAEAIAAAGADLIAIDATQRSRPGDETVPAMIELIHALGKPVMANVDTLEAAIAAESAGADCVGTTLYGYTTQTQHQSPPGLDLLTQMTQKLRVPVLCEGGTTSPTMAQAALERGAYAVVVGSDITGIDLKVKAYQAVVSTVCSQDMIEIPTQSV